MYTVLVVDDIVENIDVLTGILKSDYHVKAAKNGKTALTVAQKTQPDIILLDIMMPEMDGYEVCTALKKNPVTNSIPVIFITAKDQALDEISGFEAGAVDYINKPINPAITKARIKTHIALSDQKKALEIQVKKKTQEINETRLEIIRKLGRAAEYKDNDTGLHVERMSRYAYLIAKAYGLNEHLAELLLNASPMHDIGKIGVPDTVLKKPGKLNEEEWRMMAEHTRIGGQIIGESKSELLSIAKIVAEQHHEKWNGEGYPEQLKATKINLFARLTSIADVFDALTSKRPYKGAWTTADAVAFIQNEKRRHFDPKGVDAFIVALPGIIDVKNKFSE